MYASMNVGICSCVGVCACMPVRMRTCMCIYECRYKYMYSCIKTIIYTQTPRAVHAIMKVCM